MPESQIPPAAFSRQFSEANPNYRPGQNEETDALFNPSITARPLHVPIAGQIAKRLNSEMEFYWAFDRNGTSPNHERVERLRAAGFDYATTDDVQMAVEDTIKGRRDGKRDGYSNEIRNGDLRLMKVSKRRWLEIRKNQQLSAILMMNPRGKAMGEDGSVMSVSSMIPGVRTEITSDATVEELKARAVVSNAGKDIAEGEFGRGNASVVSGKSVNKS
jgi:hypothetical protein